MSWLSVKKYEARSWIPKQIVTAEQYEQSRESLEIAKLVARKTNPAIWGNDERGPAAGFCGAVSAACRTHAFRGRTGKLRKLREPTDELKLIQHVIGLILTRIIAGSRKNQRSLSSYLHGFLPRRGILTGAAPHIGKAYIVKMDIKNYFESITRRTLVAAMSAGSRYGYVFPEWLKTAAVDYCFYKEPTAKTEAYPALGMPSSPSIANIVSTFLIVPPIIKLLQTGGLPGAPDTAFTMYADDMTFSSTDLKVVKVIRIIPTILRRYGLKINEKKTKILGKESSQLVCGVVVNDKLAAPRSYRRALRKNMHHLKREVELGIGDPGSINVSVLRGQVAHVEHINASQAQPLKKQLEVLEDFL